jgi:hypothetical protein
MQSSAVATTSRVTPVDVVHMSNGSVMQQTGPSPDEHAEGWDQLIRIQHWTPDGKLAFSQYSSNLLLLSEIYMIL